MTLDDETLMAFADGELSPIERKRVEGAIALDPALADRVAAFGKSRDQLRAAFAPIAHAPVPDRLTALLDDKVVAIDRSRPLRAWGIGLALAASLLLGIGLGRHWTDGATGPISVRDGTLIAAGPLARALDTQLASARGDVRVLVSFRSTSGYCRVFSSAALDGIACHEGSVWRLPRTQTGSSSNGTAYRQAGSGQAALMAAAQEMMAGAPLDAAAEEQARQGGWRGQAQ